MRKISDGRVYDTENMELIYRANRRHVEKLVAYGYYWSGDRAANYYETKGGVVVSVIDEWQLSNPITRLFGGEKFHTVETNMHVWFGNLNGAIASMQADCASHDIIVEKLRLETA